jgi:hypothetical protein
LGHVLLPFYRIRYLGRAQIPSMPAQSDRVHVVLSRDQVFILHYVLPHDPAHLPDPDGRRCLSQARLSKAWHVLAQDGHQQVYVLSAVDHCPGHALGFPHSLRL